MKPRPNERNPLVWAARSIAKGCAFAWLRLTESPRHRRERRFLRKVMRRLEVDRV